MVAGKFIFPKDAGYKLVGIQHVGGKGDAKGMDLIVMDLDAEGTLVNNQNGTRYPTTMKGTRYYEAGTMLPVYFDVQISFTAKGRDIGLHAVTARMDCSSPKS